MRVQRFISVVKMSSFRQTGPHAHHLAQAPAFTAEGPSVDIRYQVLLIDGDSLRTYEAVQELRAFIQPRTRFMKQNGRS